MGVLTFLARRFVAGETVEDATRAIEKLNEKGISGTLDVLGENVKDKDGAIKAADAYINVLDVIKKWGVNSNVSLKLTQMGLDISDEFCFQNVSRIFEKAGEYNNFVRIDMEGSDYTQRTLDIFYAAFEKYGNVGIVIQSCLYRSKDDISKLNSIGAKVRLCKGAYKEPATVAFQDKMKVNENYDTIMEILLSNGNYPAIATHDDDRIKKTKKFLDANLISKDRFEFQMLYGIRPKMQENLVLEGYNMRVYVPFGTHWLPYYSRRLRERKENVFFVLRNLFRD